MNLQSERHYKEITFVQNMERLRLLTEFRNLVTKYFDNSTLNMTTGEYAEKEEAREAKAAISHIIKRAYQIIRLADIKTSATSTPSIAFSGNGKNIDLILNIFNLGRNDISPNLAIDYIERSIDIYKSNRLFSLIRTLNPLFWLITITNYIIARRQKEKAESPLTEKTSHKCAPNSKPQV